MPSTDTDALIAGLGMDRASQLAVLKEMQERLAGRTDQLRVLLRLVPLAPLSPDALDDEDVRRAMVAAYFAARHGLDSPMAGCSCCPSLWSGTLRSAAAVKLEVPGVIALTSLLCHDCAVLPRAELLPVSGWTRRATCLWCREVGHDALRLRLVPLPPGGTSRFYNPRCYIGCGPPRT
jgi:hypothetical protein